MKEIESKLELDGALRLLVFSLFYHTRKIHILIKYAFKRVKLNNFAKM